MIVVSSKIIVLAAICFQVLSLCNLAAESRLVSLARDGTFLGLEGGDSSDECSLCLDVLDSMRERPKRATKIMGIRPVKQTLRFGKRDVELDGIEFGEPDQSDSVNVYDLLPQVDSKRAQVKQTLRFGKRNDLGNSGSKSKMRLVKQTLRFGRSGDQSSLGDACSDETCLLKV